MGADQQTVLVTGASGTVGGFVVPELVSKGYKVIAVDRPGARFDWTLPSDAPVTIRTGDLTEPSFCREAVAGDGTCRGSSSLTRYPSPFCWFLVGGPSLASSRREH